MYPYTIKVHTCTQLKYIRVHEIHEPSMLAKGVETINKQTQQTNMYILYVHYMLHVHYMYTPTSTCTLHVHTCTTVCTLHVYTCMHTTTCLYIYTTRKLHVSALYQYMHIIIILIIAKPAVQTLVYPQWHAHVHVQVHVCTHVQ